MSFVRPEVSAGLRRWSEPLACGALLVLGLWLLWRAADRGGWLLGLLGLLLSVVGAALLVGAVRRVRLRDALPGGGAVMLDEGRIGYFGPFGGGFVDLPSLVRVEATGDAWVLTTEDGERLTIPRGAAGAEGLPDAFIRLPGLDLDAAVAARGPRRTLVWARGSR